MVVAGIVHPKEASMIPTIGRIVHYRIGGTDEHPVLRPATVVLMSGNGEHVNLRVDLDPFNDQTDIPLWFEARGAGENNVAVVRQRVVFEDLVRREREDLADEIPTTLYAYSATEGEGVGQWRWPART